jgi:hypothetical protein
VHREPEGEFYQDGNDVIFTPPALSGGRQRGRRGLPARSGRRRLPRSIAPAVNPQKRPGKGPRARRLFRRATADATNPPIAATVATASGRATRCVGPSDPYRTPGRRLVGRLVRPNHRLHWVSSAASGRDQREREASAAGCRTRSDVRLSRPSTADVVPRRRCGGCRLDIDGAASPSTWIRVSGASVWMPKRRDTAISLGYQSIPDCAASSPYGYIESSAVKKSLRPEGRSESLGGSSAAPSPHPIRPVAPRFLVRCVTTPPGWDVMQRCHRRSN